MLETGRRYRKNFLAALPALAALLVGCGGSQNPAPSVLPVSRALSATALTGIDSGETLANETVGEIRSANALLAETADWLAAAGNTRAVYSKTINGVTATLTVTEVSRTKSSFKIVLNGTAGSVTYTDFLWCEGTSEAGTSGGKVGTHQLSTWYALTGGASTVRATGESWFFGDGSVDGTVAFTGGKAMVFGRTSAGVWTFALHTGAADSTPVVADATVNTDQSGTARLLCTSSATPRLTLTWTAARTGQVCLFETACGGSDRPCRSFPAP